MQKALPHTCQVAPLQTRFFPLDAVICKDPAYSLRHRAVSLSLSHRALVLRSTIGNVPNLFHAHRSLCFSFLRKGLEHVPQFEEPEEKSPRTEAAKNIEVVFFACERKCDKFEKVTHNGSHYHCKATVRKTGHKMPPCKSQKLAAGEQVGKGEHSSPNSAFIFYPLSVLLRKESAGAVFLLL